MFLSGLIAYIQFNKPASYQGCGQPAVWEPHVVFDIITVSDCHSQTFTLHFAEIATLIFSIMVHLTKEPLCTNILMRFKQDCLRFLVELCVQIRNWFPLNKDSLIAQLKVFDPKFASNNRISPPSLSHLLVKSEVNDLDQWRSYRLTAKDLPL